MNSLDPRPSDWAALLTKVMVFLRSYHQSWIDLVIYLLLQSAEPAQTDLRYLDLRYLDLHHLKETWKLAYGTPSPAYMPMRREYLLCSSHELV